jgi:hypothetical protein
MGGTLLYRNTKSWEWCGYFLIKYWYGFIGYAIFLEFHSKVKFTLEQATKAQRGRGGVAVFFLSPWCYLGWVVNTTPRPLYPWERDPLPIL